tara:strand:- start:1117 stop:1773 length:657 start_codon:yes stop_codon:yes gene_type:complete
MAEVNLLANYPKTKRNLQDAARERTDHERIVARKFDKEFFDGERKYGYGGYTYNIKYWNSVVQDIYKYYKLKENAKILDVGCGKGFMLFDFKLNYPNLIVKGIDISKYAISNAIKEVKENLLVSSCDNIPFPDNYFDLVISINTIHNLDLKGCAKSLKEISRVSNKHKFIIVDAYSNNDEKKRMFEWNLTAKTIMHKKEWIKFFKQNNYDGDYYWFTP